MSEKNKPLNTVLIGAGTISRNYRTGLIASDKIDLSAVLDVDKNAPGFSCFPDVRHVFDFDSLKELTDLDLAVIATPPETHYDLIHSCLDLGLNVIAEKPLIPDIEKIKEVYSSAENKGLFLNNVFHWQHGAEVVAFNRSYSPQVINSIEITIQDDYCLNGTSLKTDKFGLGGAWLDSGINALSIIKLWLPFEKIENRSADFEYADNVDLPIKCAVRLIIDGVNTLISVDWSRHSSSKLTRISFDGRNVLIDHSGQSIIDNGKLYSFGSMPRLESHYYNYFTDLFCYSNREESLLIHDALLFVRCSGK